MLVSGIHAFGSLTIALDGSNAVVRLKKDQEDAVSFCAAEIPGLEILLKQGPITLRSAHRFTRMEAYQQRATHAVRCVIPARDQDGETVIRTAIESLSAVPIASRPITWSFDDRLWEKRLERWGFLEMAIHGNELHMRRHTRDFNPVKLVGLPRTVFDAALQGEFEHESLDSFFLYNNGVDWNSPARHVQTQVTWKYKPYHLVRMSFQTSLRAALAKSLSITADGGKE